MKALFYSLIASALAFACAVANPLRIVATTPDLAALAAEIGGDAVEIRCLAKPTDDPHAVEAKPSFIRDLHTADLFIQTGFDLEAGWIPALLKAARNPRILSGQAGFLDASRVIEPRDVPTGRVDRTMGDVHPSGNPHYLLDPRAGRAVARLLAQRFSEAMPEAAPLFQDNLKAFEKRLDEAEARWDELLRPHRGTKVIADHALWSYFADRFGFIVVAHLEPKPGVPPSSRHLQAVVETVRREGVRLILLSPYFDERHADFVARHSGARVVRLVHQPGARPGSEGYIGMLSYNIDALKNALRQSE